jgi:5-methylcytosine-specific restriction protein A
MAHTSPKPCSVCRALVHDGTSRCADHKPAAWAKRPDAPKRTTGRRLQAERAALFQREPLCRPCCCSGRVTLATQRDHIVPLTEGGSDTEENTQPICDECHEAKTLAEAARARAGGGQKFETKAPETGRQVNFLRG